MRTFLIYAAVVSPPFQIFFFRIFLAIKYNTSKLNLDRVLVTSCWGTRLDRDEYIRGAIVKKQPTN